MLSINLYKEHGLNLDVWDSLSKSKVVGIDDMVSEYEVGQYFKSILHLFDIEGNIYNGQDEYITLSMIHFYVV